LDTVRHGGPMRINPNRKCGIRRPPLTARVFTQVLCQKAFTIIELMTVVITIGIMLAGATIMYAMTFRSTDVKGSAEVLKEDIRKVYSMSAMGAGDGVDSTGIRKRDQYRILISTSYGTDHPNSYQIQTRTWAGTDYGAWTTINPKSGEAVSTSEGWIKPSGRSAKIDVLNGSGGVITDSTPYSIVFVSKGSIVQTQQTGDTTIRLSNGTRRTDLTVSIYGDVT
jgi:type II secretory pathway pseudopilin PulG